MSFPILSAIIFVPLIGAIVAMFLPRRIAWGWSLAIALVDLGLTAAVGLQFQPANGAFQLREAQPWIPSLGLNYLLGVDGISLFLIILSALLSVVAIAASFAPFRNDHATHGGMDLGLMLLLLVGIQGVFLATNVFLFYVFWEIMLVPAYLLIGTFGGPNRARAALKFVIYTAVGSLCMLLGVIGLGAVATTASGHTLDLAALTGHVPASAQGILFLAFFAAFAVKAPLVPFHSWLPDAYTEAPVPVTVMLAGAMSKTGAYGFLRFCLPLFPTAARQAAPVIESLAVAGILYCAVLALVQQDFKRILGYSSISHMGVIMLGIFALNVQGIDGAVLQMVNHGITTGALFLIAGYLEQRTGTRSVQALGGLAARVPILAVTFGVAALSSLGLPGLNSFAGEFLALLGAFHANVVFGVLGTLVVIPAAWYLLRFFQGVMQGPEKELGAAHAPQHDLRLGEMAILLPLIALMVLIGFAPGPLPTRIEPSVNAGVLPTATPDMPILLPPRR